MCCTKFNEDLATERYIMDEQNLVRFEFQLNMLYFNNPQYLVFNFIRCTQQLQHIWDPNKVISLNIEAETKWPPFSRRHIQMHYLEWKCIILIKISLKFVPKGSINNIATLVQIMAWRRPGDNPLSEPMMVILLMQICITRPQWVNLRVQFCNYIFFSIWRQTR